MLQEKFPQINTSPMLKADAGNNTTETKQQLVIQAQLGLRGGYPSFLWENIVRNLSLQSLLAMKRVNTFFHKMINLTNPVKDNAFPLGKISHKDPERGKHFERIQIDYEDNKVRTMIIARNKINFLTNQIPYTLGALSIYNALNENIAEMRKNTRLCFLQERKLYLIAGSEGNPKGQFAVVKAFWLAIENGCLSAVNNLWPLALKMLSYYEQFKILELFSQGGKYTFLEPFIVSNKSHLSRAIRALSEQRKELDNQFGILQVVSLESILIAKSRELKSLEVICDILGISLELKKSKIELWKNLYQCPIEDPNAQQKREQYFLAMKDRQDNLLSMAFACGEDSISYENGIGFFINNIADFDLNLETG